MHANDAGAALIRVGQFKNWPRVRLPHQAGELVLGPGQYWVYGGGARPALAAQSFDSRYWGPVRCASIRRVSVLLPSMRPSSGAAPGDAGALDGRMDRAQNQCMAAGHRPMRWPRAEIFTSAAGMGMGEPVMR